MMKSNSIAAVLKDNSGKVNLTSLSIPKLNKGQVLVKILFSGICGSQINEIVGRKGKDKYLPHTLGHEAVGFVVKTFNKSSNFKKGDKVILSWIKSKKKDPKFPKYLSKKTIINSGPISTFMNYSIVSENRVFKIKSNIENHFLPLLGCAIPSSIGVFKNIIKQNLKKKKIGIFGCGGLGLISLCYLKSKSKMVYGFDINKKKLEIIKKTGANIINVKNKNIKTILDELNGPLDLAVDTSGSKKSIENAFKLLKKNGILVISSNIENNKKILLDPFEFIKGKKIIGNWGGNTNMTRDLPFYLKFLIKEKKFFKRHILRIYNFKNINNAIKDMINGNVVRPIIKL